MLPNLDMVLTTLNEFAHSWLNTGLLLLDVVIIAVLIPTIILQRRESGATLAWMVVIVFLPFIGLILFWILGTTRLHMRRRKRQRVEEKLAHDLAPVQARLRKTWRVEHINIPPSLVRLVNKVDHVGPIAGNKVKIMRDGQQVFNALEQSFDEAKHHIHLLYYIWEPDFTGQRLLDALVLAAKRGVEVRLLVDDVGSSSAKRAFFKPLVDAGGKVARFLKVNVLSRQLNLNNRNHRKVVIVDGWIGFTGGMNVGNDYAGIGIAWLDLHSSFKGPVVNDLQEVFAQDWYQATQENLVNADYFPLVEAQGSVYAQFLASGPADKQWQSIHTVLFSAMNLATDCIWIETPYFVPDNAILLTIQTAALRGLDVRLLLPGKSDHALVLYAGRSFIDDLLRAGVRVFELSGAMPHGKGVVIDSHFASVGSANMDQRSFRLNFEGNMFFYNEDVANQLKAGFLELCAQAEEITLEKRKQLGVIRHLAESAANIMSPLL